MLPTLAQIQGLRNVSFLYFYIFKNNDSQNHSKGDKKGEVKERPKDAQFKGPKDRERARLSCGRKLFHPWPL